MVLINCIFQNFIHTIFPSVDWLFLFFYNLNDSSRKIVINDLTTLRQIFVQLLLIKSWFWQHLSSVLATLSLRKWNSSNKSNIVIDIYFKRKIFLRIFCLRLNNYCHAWQTLTTLYSNKVWEIFWAGYLHEVKPKPRFSASSEPLGFSIRELFSLNIYPLTASFRSSELLQPVDTFGIKVMISLGLTQYSLKLIFKVIFYTEKGAPFLKV